MEHISEIMQRMELCQEVLKRKGVKNIKELQELYKKDLDKKGDEDGY